MSPVSAEELARDAMHPTRVAMEQNGLTLQKLVTKGAELLDAKKTVLKTLKGSQKEKPDSSEKDASGARVLFETDEQALVAVDMVDNSTQLSALELLHKLRGDFPAAKHEVEADGLKDLADRLDRAYARGKQTKED